MPRFNIYSENGKYGFRTLNGKRPPNEYDTVAAQYDSIKTSHRELALVSKSGKWGATNLKGQLILPIIYDEICVGNYVSDMGYCKIKLTNKFGFIDRTGKVVINPIYESVAFFYQGLAKVKPFGKPWGYIDEAETEYF